jgi:hypothetical protein
MKSGTCHDRKVCLLPRRINEVIVPRLDVYKSQKRPETWGAILETKTEHRRHQETAEHAVDLTQLIVGSGLCMFTIFYVFDCFVMSS